MAIAAEMSALTREQMLHMFRQMSEIRAFETRAYELYREGVMRGTTHAYVGEEAIGVGICAALHQDDTITSTHRGHGHCIAKGGDVAMMMAELLGKDTGYCHGKGGSMHIADVDKGILGANGIVGGGMGIATGAGLSAKLLGNGRVSVCFFGDGALNQGILHESMNLAAIWKLPVIYVCENNQYAMSSRVQDMTAVADPSVRAVAYGIPGVNVDGMDVLAVYRAAAQAVERARAGEGPSFIVATTYRFLGHHVGDPLNYRTKEEVEDWREKDAIERFKSWLADHGLLSDEEADQITQEVQAEVDNASDFAKKSPEPVPAILMDDIYA
ncbi:MAG: thiamine pyrophosphate-dependent dehydrogenase E1 component subunit alpha [Chloroflexi bacterium]|nr:thiamine pyrophosphate-dependent dehydrogenase E1 component subunit alpha [Chloroflexota bacterium]